MFLYSRRHTDRSLRAISSENLNASIVVYSNFCTVGARGFIEIINADVFFQCVQSRKYVRMSGLATLDCKRNVKDPQFFS